MIEEEVKNILQIAIQQQASDIHLMPKSGHYELLLSVHGQLNFLKELTDKDAKRMIAQLKFLADLDVGEKRRPQSGACEFEIEKEMPPIELRLSTITDVNLKESLVIRVIYSRIHQAQAVNCYFPSDLQRLKSLVQRKSGLILISGPVGSGKTTTIYQLLRERMAHEQLQIITMEDPVEIREESFLQTQINEKAAISYDLLIKSALRHHPDILFIGEIRDEETARMTIRGALTGHLMIATLHATNTLGVIGRLMELQISPQQLSQTLIGVVSQRLVPRYCLCCHKISTNHCPHIPATQKRAALFELLTGPTLKEVILQGQKQVIDQPVGPKLTLNHQLRKAWAYGYIHQESYHQFEVL